MSTTLRRRRPGCAPPPGRASRMRGQAALAALAACVALSGCSAVDALRQPEGSGGWDRAERNEALGEIARGAGVAYEPAATPAPTVARLDLRTTLELAARNNRRIEIARQQVAGAAERVYDARGRLLPASTGSGRYTWYSDPLRNDVNLPPDLFPPGVTPSFVFRQDNFGTVNGTTLLPLDVTGELWHALFAAQAGYRGEQARLWATTLEQQFLAVRAYFQHLEALRLREVTRQTIALYRRQLDDAQTRFDAGRVTKNDVLVVQVALRDAEQVLVRRDLEVDRTRWNLNQQIGGDIDASVELEDVALPPDLPSADEALQAAFRTNPGLETLIQEQQRLEETLTSLERSRLPRPYGGGAIDYSSATIIQPQTVGSGFVGFSWDLGTDTRREAQIAEARIAAERNQTAIQAQMREIENAVRATRRSAEERLAAYASAEVAVGQAEENLRIRAQQFGAGRAQSTDVLDAEILLASQRATLATALYQAHTRRAELQQLVGLPLAQAMPAQR